MRVSPVSLIYKPIHFTHCKKSQKYIEQKAQTIENKSFANALLRTSNLCNEMEAEIKKEEPKAKTDEQEQAFRAYVDLYANVKCDLLDFVMYEFPDGRKYLESEKKYYKNAYDRCKEDGRPNFRQEILKRISTWNDVSKEEQKQTVQTEEAQAETSSAQNTVKENKEEKQASDKKPQNVQLASTSDIAYYILLQSRPQGVMLDVLRKNPNSPNGFCDVSGMEDLKEELTEEIIEPIKNPKRAELDLMEYGKEVPKGVLLYGPPGCGKTYIVEALAQELDTVVYKLGIDKAGSKYINETSTNIRKSFDYAEAAARTFEKPVVLFMDEIDSLIMKRSEALNEENLKQVATLLQCIEHAQQNNVIVVGATNRYELIDPAAIRRFPVKKPVLSPETPQIKEHLKRSLEKKLKGQKLSNDDNALDKISKALDSYSYKSIDVISSNASEHARKRNRADISVEDYKYAIENTNEEKVDNGNYLPKPKAKIGFAQESLQ